MTSGPNRIEPSDSLEADRRRVNLDIRFHPKAGVSTPVQVDLDFDALLGQSEGERLIDPHTIVVKRQMGGGEREYPVQFLESLYYENKGWVAWRVDEPRAGGEWWMEFSLRDTSGDLAAAPYKPMVGVGDELHYNGERWQPLAVPGRHHNPIAVDWTGDGRIDILSNSAHTDSIGMPRGGIFCWKNIGSNEEPRYSHPMRICADGVVESSNLGTDAHTPRISFEPRHDFINEDYIHCDAFDWFGTGRPDLITISRTGGIKVYRNHGDLDATGMPRLELALHMDQPGCIAPGRLLHIRVVDWDGSGRPSMVIGVIYHDKETFARREQIALIRNTGGTRETPTFEETPFPIAGYRAPAGQKIPADWRQYSNFDDHRPIAFDVFDIDGDGRLELMCCHYRHRPDPMMDMYRNIGSLEEPELLPEGPLPWSRFYDYFGFRFVRNQAFDGVLYGGRGAGYGIHYYRRVGDDPMDPGCYVDTGPLLGESCKVKQEGFYRPTPVDADGSGRMSLLCGDLMGRLTLTRNIGTGDRPAFATPERTRDGEGREFHLKRDDIAHDNNGEFLCGMLKPTLCDWDGDGRLDVIIGNNTNHLFWLEGYDPQRNRFEAMHRLKVRGTRNPFCDRKGPAVLDWFGSGRLDLVTADNHRRMCIFRQGPGEEGLLLLEPGIPLAYEDGEIITTNSIGRGWYTQMSCGPNISLDVCDWTGSGTYDLLVAAHLHQLLLENVGTNQDPVFKRPEAFEGQTGVVEISHHDSALAACDWDGDDRLDLMVGGESGSLYLFHRDWLEGRVHEVRFGSTISREE